MIKEYTIKSNSENEDYSVVLFFIDGCLIPEKSSCTCTWSSFYRFTKENTSKNKWKCAHMTEAIKRYKNGEKDNIQKEREEIEKEEIKAKPINDIFK